MPKQYLLVELPDTLDLSEDVARGVMVSTASKDRFRTVCETERAHLLKIDDMQFDIGTEGDTVTFPRGVTRVRKMDPLSLSELSAISGEVHRLLGIQSLLGHMKVAGGESRVIRP